jgi:hypothetical protein
VEKLWAVYRLSYGLEVLRFVFQRQQDILTFICFRATLSYDVAHRTVSSWRQNSFGCFSRWPWNTLRNCMCGVACCRKEWGKRNNDNKRYTMRRIERGFWGVVVGEKWTEKESIQQYFYNRYKILYKCHTYCCYAYHFYAYWLYFIYVWHVYVSPKTCKRFGTFILKDGRYTFTFLSPPNSVQRLGSPPTHLVNLYRCSFLGKTREMTWERWEWRTGNRGCKKVNNGKK